MTKEDHKKLGITYFNKTWDFIDQKNRSKESDLQMIHFAHASRLHWELSGAPMINIVRGEWQISHVYSILGMGESALYHATYCLEETIKNNFGDFDLVFAYEAMAFAYKVLGNDALMNKHLELGYSAIDGCKKQDDQKYCKSELDKIKK